MSTSAKVNVDELLATRSYQLCKQKSHEIRAAMEALMYCAETVSSTQHRQFQLHLNSSQQAATTWSDADRQGGI